MKFCRLFNFENINVPGCSWSRCWAPRGRWCNGPRWTPGKLLKLFQMKPLVHCIQDMHWFWYQNSLKHIYHDQLKLMSNLTFSQLLRLFCFKNSISSPWQVKSSSQTEMKLRRIQEEFRTFLKPNYFKKQRFSSSFLLTWSRYIYRFQMASRGYSHDV